MDTKEQQEWQAAGQRAKDRTKEIAKKKGVTIHKAMAVIAEGLKADIVRPFKTSDDQIIYSKKLVDHTTRLKAADMTLEIHEAKPSQKIDHTHGLSQNVMGLVVQVVQKMKGEDE